MTANGALLSVTGLHCHYGNIHALKDVSLEVRPGEIVSLIGANGAGKTTTLHCIVRLLQATSGTLTFEGGSLGDVPAEEIVARGIALVPEGRKIFPRLTVDENLQMGAFIRTDVAAIQEDRDRMFEMFPRLAERRKQSGGTLSGGEQQMLAIGRALMSRPRLLLLDEPSLGLAPLMVERIFETIAELKSQGRTILLVEQNVHHALDIADRAYVLETGRITLDGPADVLRRNPKVEQSYLGVGGVST
jgi:branched-chain amino acid transport system ATP-binding protein